MRVHFIAIGGAAMHNLALALHKKGYIVSGSDDEIFEPSKSRLNKAGILPEKMGWFPEKITPKLDAVILGMHARKDNPELIKAQEMGLNIYSYPEYLYEQSKDKTRVVIAGSHGKTTITSMVMHVLKYHQKNFDYMVGSILEGFDTMVRLSSDAEYIILEGDEYLSSPIDLKSKFLWYRPQIALISGIAWDHINVFPTLDNYIEQFERFAESISDHGFLTYFSGDENLQKIAKRHENRIHTKAYQTHPHSLINNQTRLETNKGTLDIKVFGEHNLQNISGAKNICLEIGISEQEFYEAISTFKGAAKRLQTLKKTETSHIFLDFAHSPSKLKATTEAVKHQFPNRPLIACMELHTFSSLKKEFLTHYQSCMDKADTAIVYFNPKTVEHKKLEPISKDDVFKAFGNPNLRVMTDALEMTNFLKSEYTGAQNVLLMTSGNFDGIDLKAFAEELTNH